MSLCKLTHRERYHTLEPLSKINYFKDHLTLHIAFFFINLITCLARLERALFLCFSCARCVTFLFFDFRSDAFTTIKAVAFCTTCGQKRFIAPLHNPISDLDQKTDRGPQQNKQEASPCGRFCRSVCIDIDVFCSADGNLFRCIIMHDRLISLEWYQVAVSWCRWIFYFIKMTALGCHGGQ